MLRGIIIPHFDCDVTSLKRHVGKEVVARGQRLFYRLSVGVFAIIDFHVVRACLSAAVVDAKTEQRMVTHTPKLLLIGQALHTGGFEHLFHFIDFHLITVD